MVLVWLEGRWGNEDVWRVYQDGRRITFSSVLKHLSVSESTRALQLLDERLARCGLSRMTCDDVEGSVLAPWLLSNRADMAFNSSEALVPLQVPVKATVAGHTLKASRQIFQLVSQMDSAQSRAPQCALFVRSCSNAICFQPGT